MSKDLGLNRAGGTIVFLKPYPRVAAYFLLAGTVLFFAVRFLVAFGNRFNGLAPSGGDYHDGRYLPWAVFAYCVLGALTGYFGVLRNRKILMALAHGAILIASILETGKLTEALLGGLVLSVLLAIPFGFAWFLLVTAKANA